MNANVKSFYRVYRPKNFAEVVGQDFITRTLSNQIANQKRLPLYEAAYRDTLENPLYANSTRAMYTTKLSPATLSAAKTARISIVPNPALPIRCQRTEADITKSKAASSSVCV